MSLVPRFRAAASILALAAALSFAPPALAQDANVVVATVDGVPITEADLALAAQDFRDTLSQLPPEQRMMGLINGLIDIRLMARAAEAAGLDKDPAAMNRLAFIRDRALRSEFLRARVFGEVTDDAVQKAYDEYTGAFVPQEQVRASHILVETEDEAKAIIAELDGGADFAEIAKVKSLDLGSGANGGDLDFLSRGQTVPSFDAAVFALEPGTYTKTPVQSQYGWHVILLAEKRMSQPEALDAMRDSLRDQLAEKLFIAELDKLRTAAKIEIVTPEPPAADAPATNAPAEPAAPQ